MAEKEYIEAKQVLLILNDLVNDTPDKEEFYNRVFEEVDAMRAADVVPRAEVAREIFAEIEASLHYKLIDGEIYLVIREADYKHYKKKYMEGRE